MKLHAIVIHNLHSLASASPVTIAFNQAPLQGCGLFAITGPTGAGKTTILDALTLALYGEIARPGGQEREVISHGAALCSAEVIFETAGGCFKARWALRRARGKATGALQPTERELAHYPSGKILTNKIAEVDALIQETIGLTKEQFLKSVLLAQGKFMEFLQAKDGERATLLEKLTGTGIYRRLSTACFEQQKAQGQQLETLQRDTENLVLLTAEEKEFQLQRQQAAKEESAELNARLDTLEAELHWHQQTVTLIKNQSVAEEAFQSAFRNKETAAPLYQRWIQHQAVAPLEVKLHQWKQAQKDTTARELDVEKAAQKTAEVQQLVTAHETILQQATEAQQLCKEALAQAAPALRKAMQTEVILSEKNAAHEKEAARLQSLSGKILALQADTQKLQADLANQQTEIDDITYWLQAHERDSQLEEVLLALTPQTALLTGLRERTGFLQQQITAIEKRREELKEAQEQAQADLQIFRKKGEAISTRLAEIDQAQQHQKCTFLTVQATQRTRQQTQELVVAKLQREVGAIQFYIIHHQQLQPGHPCDLCGSTEHPNAQQDLSLRQQDLTESQQALEAALKFQKELTNQLAQTETALALLDEVEMLPETENAVPETLEVVQGMQAEKQRLDVLLPTVQNDEWQATIRLQKAVEAQEQQTSDLAKYEADRQETQNETAHGMLHFRQVADAYEIAFPEAGETAFTNQLRNRFNQYKIQETALEKLQLAQQNQQALFLKQLAALDSQRTEQTALQTEVYTLAETIQSMELAVAQAHPASFASASAYYQHLEIQCSIADAALHKATQRKGELDQQLTFAQHRHEDVRAQLQQRSGTLEILCRELSQDLRAKALPEDFDAAVALLLAPAERQTTEAAIGKINAQLSQAETLHNQAQRDLEAHLQLASSVQPLPVLHEQREALRKSYNEAQQAIGQATQILQENQAKEVLLSGKAVAMQTQAGLVRRWQALNDLIGSANGDVFARFAQTLSLDQLLVHTNGHLRHLSDRYRLRRKPEGKEALGIQVEDRYLAGTLREVGSLSGGETFLVSLGLALGLADMASEHTPIESLFIDEGFGSLDADSLEDALQALENIQARGKTIGIISHVEQLKERIPTQIVVQKTGDGISRIEIVPR